MRFRPTIFVQIWLPFTFMIVLVLGVLAFYYPQRQRQVLSGFKKEELAQSAKMVALGVQLSIDSDDFPGLQKTMSTIRESQRLDYISMVVSDSISGDAIFETFPSDFKLQLNAIDSIQYLNVKAPFLSSIFKGYIIMGIEQSKVFKNIDALNRPMMVFLLFIAVLTMLVVYLIADKITSPISWVQNFANQLQKGDYSTDDRLEARAVELVSLNDSLQDLAKTLQQQRKDNQLLTTGLEEKIKERTVELDRALIDLNDAQKISHLGSFEYYMYLDHWNGSDNLFQILGIDKENYVRTYASFLSLLHPEDRESIHQSFEQGRLTGQELNFECRLTRPSDDKEIWVNCRAKYFSDKEGRSSKMSGVIQDISERKQVEEELNILSLVAKKTSNAVIITNLHKEIQWVNESVLEITGYSREEIIGNTPKMFQFEKTDPGEIARINNAIQNRQPVWAELINRSKSGHEYWLSINIVPLKDEKGVLKGFMAVETDISERKKLEAQREEYVKLLEQSKQEIEKINEELEEKVREKTKNIEHLALFPEQNPNPVVELNFDLRELSYSNPAARTILPQFLELNFDAQLLSLNVTSLDNVLAANKSEFIIGELIFEVNLFLLEDKNILRAYLHNITQRKQQESQLAALVAQLQSAETELLEKKSELEKSLQELTLAQSEIISKERLSTLGMLIAGIAHEINTPLGAIKASGENLKYLFTEGVMKLIGDMNPEALNLSIQLYEKSSMHSLSTSEERLRTQELTQDMEGMDFPLRYKQKMARMLVQMGIFRMDEQLKEWMHHPFAESIFQLGLNFVLILRSIVTTTASSDQGGKVVKALNSFAHGNVGSEFTTFDLKESIDTVITILWNKIKQGSRVINAIPEDIQCFALADELSQVWTNLMNNALQASGNKCLITFEYADDGVNHIITVGNDGPPIPSEIIEKIFEPFFTTKARGEGTGLGLNIVRKIIEKHKGTIICQSEDSLTKFIVSLPKSN